MGEQPTREFSLSLLCSHTNVHILVYKIKRNGERNYQFRSPFRFIIRLLCSPPPLGRVGRESELYGRSTLSLPDRFTPLQAGLKELLAQIRVYAESPDRLLFNRVIPVSMFLNLPGQIG